MNATINGLNVYDAVLIDEDCGMVKISLVDFPAVESDWIAFSKKEKVERKVLFSVTDEEKRIVRGVVMRADFPIYRRDENGYEYYIVYRADTIRKMAEKYLLEGRQNNINLMHEDGTDIEGVQMVQYFIKDSKNGIDPEGFEDIADGSLFAEFHIVNDKVWEAVKEGVFKGFSLEGYFGFQPLAQGELDSWDEIFKLLYKNDMTKIERLREALKKALLEFGNVTTDKAVLYWEGEEDLAEGMEVYIENEEGERKPAEDGDYTTEDGKVIKVVDGKVAEIVDSKAEVAEEPTEEPAEEAEAAEEEPIEDREPEAEAPEAEEPKEEADLDELKARIDALEGALAELTARIEKLESAPAAESAHEEFSKKEYPTFSLAKSDRRNAHKLSL